MTEKQWQSQVVKLAKLNGWRVYHTFDSRRSTAGFPDLVLVKGKRLIFAELKTEHGRIRPEQTEWMDALKATGAKVYLWRPDDNKTVLSVLSGRIDSDLDIWYQWKASESKGAKREPVERGRGSAKPVKGWDQGLSKIERKARRDAILERARNA